jgi:hypothetical protein
LFCDFNGSHHRAPLRLSFANPTSRGDELAQKFLFFVIEHCLGQQLRPPIERSGQ